MHVTDFFHLFFCFSRWFFLFFVAQQYQFILKVTNPATSCTGNWLNEILAYWGRWRIWCVKWLISDEISCSIQSFISLIRKIFFFKQMARKKTEWIFKFTFPICSSWLRATHSLGTYTEQYTIHFGVLWCFTDNFIKMSKCKLNRKLYLNLMCNSNLPQMAVENLLEAKAKNQTKAKRITTWNSFMWKLCRDITIHLH